MPVELGNQLGVYCLLSLLPDTPIHPATVQRPLPVLRRLGRGLLPRLLIQAAVYCLLSLLPDTPIHPATVQRPLPVLRKLGRGLLPRLLMPVESGYKLLSTTPATCNYATTTSPAEAWPRRRPQPPSPLACPARSPAASSHQPTLCTNYSTCF